MNPSSDVLIIGAGAAGLFAAYELSARGLSVCVLEARDRTGGRVLTVQDGGAHELGAEFIHGEGPCTKELLARMGNGSAHSAGSIWQYRDGQLRRAEEFIDDWQSVQAALEEVKTDIPVQEFLDRHLRGDALARTREQVARYAEGYYAADLRQASTHALRDELAGGDHEDDARPFTGYGPVLHFLEERCRAAGVRFELNTAAQSVAWSDAGVRVETTRGTFTARRLLSTLPIGVWRSGALRWTPGLPLKERAVAQLGYGSVIKVVLAFRERFWEDAALCTRSAPGLGFLFSEERIPTWWTGAPEQGNLLTGWKAGPPALEMAGLDGEALLAEALQCLGNIFGCAAGTLRDQLNGHYFHNWLHDPFTQGGYGFEVVNGGRYIEEAAKPEAGTLFFAGEGLYDGPAIGTVEAALQTAKKAVRGILGAARTATSNQDDGTSDQRS